jgi:hypothetical protein
MNESLEFHYKEMVRLASIFDSHSKDAFNDFKLLGAVGALLSWGPLSLSFEQIQPKAMCCWGSWPFSLLPGWWGYLLSCGNRS